MERYLDRFAEEKTIRQRSLLLTGIFLLLVWLISYFWVLMRDTVPPADENPYIIAGRVDFGNLSSGSSTQNSFLPPSDVKQEETTEKSPSSFRNDEQVITSNQSQSSVADTLKQQKAKRTESVDKSLLFEYTEGGSNEGNSESVGNEGTPSSPVLDSEGLFQFGEGEMGLQGRIPLSLPKPEYKVNQETRITYEFVIAPDGHVKSVRPITFSTATELIEAGKEAIYKWRFNAIPGKQDQKARVTITFRLK